MSFNSSRSVDKSFSKIKDSNEKGQNSSDSSNLKLEEHQKALQKMKELFPTSTELDSFLARISKPKVENKSKI